MHRGRKRITIPDPNPNGVCFCGCGKRTTIAKVTSRKQGMARGCHVRYIFGHSIFKAQKLHPQKISPPTNDPNPTGKCMCGCGLLTTIVTRSDWRKGYKMGDHRKYRLKHSQKISKGNRKHYKISNITGCWVWLQARNKEGYGMWGTGKGTNFAHKRIYVKEKGEIPKGLELDHLCKTRACVNPDHLEPVTHKENMRRTSHKLYPIFFEN